MATLDAFRSRMYDTERGRLDDLVSLLERWSDLFRGRRVLDFGASWGLSMVALAEWGAEKVIGVEPQRYRIEKWRDMPDPAKPEAAGRIIHCTDTSSLPFPDASFEVVTCIAVLEHIPQPRTPYIEEMWRVLEPGGHLLVLETPNKYLPKDVHTTGLWWVPWLPETVAKTYAEWRGATNEDGSRWEVSGWRGLGYRELVAPISDYKPEFRVVNRRQEALARLGLPPILLDPYPEVALKKMA